MSVVLKDVPKNDRLSQLPPELLDDIFDLVAFSHKLCTVPPSKSLRPFHEKTLYRYIRFDDAARFEQFARTITKDPSKTVLTRGCNSIVNFYIINTYSLLRVVQGLSRLVIDRSASPTSFFSHGTDLGHFSTLHTLTFSRYRSDSLVGRLQQIPSLRNMELIDVEFASDSSSKPTARQVTELAVIHTAQISPTIAPSSLLSYFPSASIVKLDLTCSNTSEFESIRSILTQLTPSLRILRLQYRASPGGFSSEPIDDLLPLFPSLREVHLDDKFLSYDNHDHLLALHDLVELSLVLEDLYPEFVHLLEGPQRLRHLQKLSLKFSTIKPGGCLDLDYATYERRDAHCDEDGNGVMLLDHCESISDMYDWELPFSNDFEEGMALAIKLEKVAREADIFVSTNLEMIRFSLPRHIIEYFSRGIGHYYFDGITWRIEEAQALAEAYKVTLPPVEVNLEEEIETEKLQWFKVRMKNVEIDGKGECYALNLRLQTK
ncbi:hypothetical protein JCM5353_005483 [Sporobolomyces roseus]